MKRIICLPLLTLLISFSQAQLVYAAEVLQPGCQGVSNSTLCDDNNRTQNTANNSIYGPNGIITKAANLLLIIVGVAGVIMIMVGGILYSLSGGDSQRVNQAKDLIIYALVGMVVAVFARGIIGFVLSKL